MNIEMNSKTEECVVNDVDDENNAVGEPGVQTDATDETKIPVKKTDAVLGFVGSLVFSLCGIALLGESPAAALGCIALFGLGAFICWKQIRDTRPGLILNSHGFMFPRRGVIPGPADKFGLVPWANVDTCVEDEIRIEKEGTREKHVILDKTKDGIKEIDSYETSEYTAHKYLFVVLNDPNAYLQKLGVFTRMGAVTKGTSYESPIAIPKKSKLKIKFSDLCELFDRYHSKYRFE